MGRCVAGLAILAVLLACAPFAMAQNITDPNATAQNTVQMTGAVSAAAPAVTDASKNTSANWTGVNDAPVQRAPLEGVDGYWLLHGNSEMGVWDANGARVLDCARLETLFTRSYAALNDTDYLRGRFDGDLNAFNRSRGPERTCRYMLGYSHYPCVDHATCFRDCFMMPMCTDIAASDYVINFSMFIYSDTIELDAAADSCRAIALGAGGPSDFRPMQTCLDQMEQYAHGYLSSPLVGSRDGALEYCPVANYSFGSIQAMRERIRQLTLASAISAHERAQTLCSDAGGLGIGGDAINISDGTGADLRALGIDTEHAWDHRRAGG